MEDVSVMPTRASRAAEAHSCPNSNGVRDGAETGGSPVGSAPTISTPRSLRLQANVAAKARATTTSASGIRGKSRRARSAMAMQAAKRPGTRTSRRDQASAASARKAGRWMPERADGGGAPMMRSAAAAMKPSVAGMGIARTRKPSRAAAKQENEDADHQRQ